MPKARRPRYTYEKSGETAKKRRLQLFPVALALIAVTAALLFVRELSTQIALSDAGDAVAVTVGETVAGIMQSGAYDTDAFVSIEKNNAGAVTAVKCSMAQINALSADVLSRIVGATESRRMTISIPAGNLTGLSLLTGRGPMIPVEIVMLTSSRVELENSTVTAGINQTQHRIILKVTVDIDVFVPWGGGTTQVVSDVLVADTTIVGAVPEVYFGE